MEFKDGTSVFTIDQKDVGDLERVVIDPETRQLTHIVVKKGHVLPEDTLVPVEKVAHASHDMVTLTCSMDEIKQLPPLEVVHTVPREGNAIYEQPVAGMYTTAPITPLVVTETTRTLPENLVALKEGAKVVSSDEKHVGNVERVFTEDGKVTHLTLSHGLLAKTEKSIPYEWVEMMGEEEVDLSVDAQQIETLPEVMK